MSRSAASTGFKIALSVLVLAIVLRPVDPLVFWQTLRTLNPLFLLLAILLFFPTQLLAAYRWYFLLRKLDRRVSLRSVVRHNILGQFSALFLPGQLSGDVVRTFAIAHGQDDKALFVLSVMIDKAVLMVVLAAFALFGTITSPLLSQVFTVQLLAAALLAASLVMVVLLCRQRSAGICHRLLSFWPKLALPLRTRFAGPPNTSMPKVGLLTLCALLTLGAGVQVANTLGSMLLARAMHIAISPIDWAAITAVVAVAQVLPFSIGGLGIREVMFASLLALYSVPVAQSTAFSLLGFVLVAVLISGSWLVVEFTFTRRHQPKSMQLAE